MESDMGNFFYKLGRFVGPAARKGQWFWQTLVGSEGDEIRAEHAVGRDLAAAMEREAGVDDDPDANARVTDVGTKLARCLANQKRSFRFTITPAPEPNAFALPGGFVFVTRGLLDAIGDDDDELAFVLGHEIAHVVRKHAIERVIQSSALSILAKAAPGGSGALATWIRRSGSKLLDGAYSQDNEFDADELGARLVITAGFSHDGPERLLRRLERLAQREGRSDARDDAASAWLRYAATHPPFASRVRRVRVTVDDAR